MSDPSTAAPWWRRAAVAVSGLWPRGRARRVDVVQTWCEVAGAGCLVAAAFTLGVTAGLLALGAALLIAGNVRVEVSS